jgi:DNA adenine methylase
VTADPAFASVPEGEPVRPLLRWLGGKYRLAPWIVSHFPEHRVYLEPYGGAASVLLRKARAYNEIYNDLDGEVVNLFRVLRDPPAAAELVRLARLTPYAKAEYFAALEPCDEPVERARRLLVRSHMAHGTGGSPRINDATGFRSDGPSATTNVAGEWAEFPDALATIVERLRGVNIQSVPALELIERYSDEKVLIYLDPPYPPETRSTKARRGGHLYHAYAHEMDDDDHRALLDACRRSRSMVLLSSYPNAMYEAGLPGWTRRQKRTNAHRNSPRVEDLWINPAAIAALKSRPATVGPLFGAAA